MLLRLILAGLAALAPSQGGDDDFTVFDRDAAGWAVVRRTDGCFMFVTFRGPEEPGFNVFYTISHPDAPLAGKSAPESIQSGSRIRFTIAWKACGESIGHAMANPSAVSSKLIITMATMLMAIAAGLGCTPISGVKTRKTTP